MILESIENGPLIWPTIEENGVTRPRNYSELSAADAIHADCDVKATNIILQGLPPEFAYKKGETLRDFYLRFSLLLNDTNIYNVKLEQFQVNTKFLNTLLPEWSKFATDVKLVRDLHTTNIDQLHAYLGQHEFNANEVCLMHERNSNPLALVGRQMSLAVGTIRTYTPGASGSNSRKQRTVICYNCKGEGHMSKQCTKPKRKHDDCWFKDKVLLVAQIAQAKCFQNPFYLKKAQQLEPKLYDGNVIKNMSTIVIPDSEETLMLAEESRLKMLLKQQDHMLLEKKVNTTPVDYVNSVNSLEPTLSSRPTKFEVLKELPKVSMVNMSLKKLKYHLAGFDVVVKERTTATAITEGSALSFDQLFELNELKAQSQEKDTVIKKLKERIKSLSGKINEDKIKKDLEEIETINIELDHRVSKLIAENEHLKQTYKQLYDSIKPTRKVFTNIGYIWRPTGRTFTIVGNVCPLTRITTIAEVPLRKPTTLENETPKPIVTLVYSKKPRKCQTNIPVSKSKARRNPTYLNLKTPIKKNFNLWQSGTLRTKYVSQALKEKSTSLSLSDNYARFHWVKCLRSKDEAPDFIIKFLKMIQVRLKTPVRRIRTNNGTEFVNQTLREYYEKVGISHETSVARSPQQNGIIERRNRTLIKAARTMLIYAKAPLFLWLIAVVFYPCYIPKSSSVDYPATEVVAPIHEVVTLVPVVSTGSPSSTNFNQDAPSPSHSQTTPETQPPVFPNDVEEDNHDIVIAYVDAFLTAVEPKTYKDALTQSCWTKAMQEELNEFEHLEV
ncbi:integrase, catalytic region, zinc finger, CCHC-type containing protein [Tanacetum coccineum]